MQISETLELAGEGAARAYRCRRCEAEVGPASENYKLSALIEEAELPEANPRIGDPSRFVDEPMVFRRFYCRSCGALFDTEVARRRDEPLHDIEIA